MIGIILTPQQIEAAPPGVRAWLDGLLAESMATPRTAAPTAVAPPARPSGAPPAAIDRDEAMQIFNRINGDYLACQLLFELGRDDVRVPAPAGLHAMRIADIVRHMRIGDTERLLTRFETINAALRLVRHDTWLTLFAFDEDGNCYISQPTHQAVRELWQTFLAAQLEGLADRAAPADAPRIELPTVTVAPPYHAHAAAR